MLQIHEVEFEDEEFVNFNLLSEANSCATLWIFSQKVRFSIYFNLLSEANSCATELEAKSGEGFVIKFQSSL